MDGLTERDKKAQSGKSLVVIWTWHLPNTKTNHYTLGLDVQSQCAYCDILYALQIWTARRVYLQDLFRQRQEENLWDTPAQSATFGHHKMNRTLYQFSDDNTQQLWI